MPSRRGSTSTSTMLRPETWIASSSSLTFIVPICAVKADPDRPATMMAAIRPPSSRKNADAEQIDGEDLGAELAQLVGPLIGEDDADQERQQADDRQRVQAGLFHLMDQGRNAQPPGLQHGGDCLEHDEAEESDQLVALVQRMTEAAADAFQTSS